eukprot:TRINITY_DN87_c0_g1_i1.p1 TRINITY_DN87_c0_g1~~TRINITY_DN87_c0_g1_i1.p1  ORF type:complete len:126 (-),score=41.02 TRINITY_DN87_c0_g1_i1:46-423(-)
MSKVYTLAEVEKHNQDDDIWVIYEKNVLDITKFLNEHPGGDDVLKEIAGDDITLDFDGVGHSDEAAEMMKDFVIGTISDEDYETLKSRSNIAKPATNPNANSSTGALLPIIVILIAIAAVYFYNS